MELWDAYDARGRKTGQTLVRGESVPAGLFHLVAEIAVRHADGSYLLTRRDLGKPSYPGLWEMGAGGSVTKGEDALMGARRELFEETGIVPDAMRKAFWFVSPKARTIYAGYVAHYAGDKNAVVLQENETIAYRWLTGRELCAFCRTADFILAQRERWKVLLHKAEEENG